MILYHFPDLVIGVAHDIKSKNVICDLLERARVKEIKTKTINWKLTCPL